MSKSISSTSPASFAPSTSHLQLMLVVMAMVASMFSAACGDEDEEVTLQPTVKKAAPVKEAAEAKPAEADAPAEYTYEAVNRRDPFKTYFDELVVVEERTEALTELQRYELDKMKLVGVVVGTATPMAMVEDPTGKGHTVKINTLIGKRFGQVKHIRRGEIVVREEFRDFTGKRIPQFKPLKLEEPVARGR